MGFLLAIGIITYLLLSTGQELLVHDFDAKAVLAKTQIEMVSTFDARLPKKPLKLWLDQQIQGTTTSVSWILSDCGTIVQESGQLCSTLHVDNEEKGLVAFAHFWVGTVSEGVDMGEGFSPELLGVFVEKPDGLETIDLVQLQSLF